MASKRWEDVIEKFAEKERYCLGSDILYREDVAKLLARQHAAFMRLVRKKLQAKDTRGKTGVEIHVGLDRDVIDHFNHGFEYACNDLLAALATHRKGRT